NGTDTSPPCSGTQACNGAGSCLSVVGTTCSSGTQCASGFCVDGVCCNSACAGTCQACNLPSSSGTCSAIPQGGTDTNPSCSGAQACDGSGQCLEAVGQPCSAGTQCAGGYCADGVCCGSACNGTCQTCSLPGSIGACVNIPLGGTDTNPV